MESNNTYNVYHHIDFDITHSQTDIFLKFFLTDRPFGQTGPHQSHTERASLAKQSISK